MTLLSQVEENYIKTIYHLSGHGTSDVATNDLAQSMHIKAASVTDMIKRLFAKKLIQYKPYYGVKMTAMGKKTALQIIRRHRLWETFLVKKLRFTWDQVHEVAEQLEHIQSPALINQLDEFLDYPMEDPHGNPIPNKAGKIKTAPRLVLGASSKGYKGTVVAIKNAAPTLLKYLEKIGIKPGKKIRIVDKEADNHSIKIAIGQRNVLISEEIAQTILVTH